jgi:hypothetical protein
MILRFYCYKAEELFLDEAKLQRPQYHKKHFATISQLLRNYFATEQKKRCSLIDHTLYSLAHQCNDALSTAHSPRYTGS